MKYQELLIHPGKRQATSAEHIKTEGQRKVNEMKKIERRKKVDHILYELAIIAVMQIKFHWRNSDIKRLF